MSNYNRLSYMFDAQVKFQKKNLSCTNLPAYDKENYKYHLVAMLEELGEVLASDKRWKTHRNEKYDEKNKMEELADVLITFMNICIFSGFDIVDIMDVTGNKIIENMKRLEIANNN